MGAGDRALPRAERLKPARRKKLVFFGAVFVIVAGALLLWPVDRSTFDAVAEARSRLGIPLESSRVEGNGVYLHVVQAGPADGPPVLLLHGFPEFWWAWLPQIGDLAAAGFRVIVPDQRGYGGSDKPEPIAAYALDELVEDIAELVKNLGYEKVSLAGHDWGGRVAWHVAIRRPGVVNKLAIVNAGHPAAGADLARSPDRAETVGWYRQFFQVPGVPELVMPLGDWALPAYFFRSAMRDDVLSARDVEYYKAEWDGAIGTMIHWYRAGKRFPSTLPPDVRVSVPTLIVWGMRDPFLDSKLARLSAGYCVDAEVEELPGAGHFVMQEDPDTVSDLLIRFFSRRGS